MGKKNYNGLQEKYFDFHRQATAMANVKPLSSNFPVSTIHWRSDSDLAENLVKFLFPIPTGGGLPQWSVFCGNFYSSAYKRKSRQNRTPKRKKSPCHFRHRDINQGIKNPPQDNPCGGHRSVAILLSILSLSQSAVSCQYQVSFTSVSFSAAHLPRL